MNCQQFREHCLATPLERQARAAHRHQCPDCATFEHRALAFEAALHDALEVPVATAIPPAGWARRRRWLPALAAAAAIGAVGLTLVTALRPTPDLATLAARHMRAHPTHLLSGEVAGEQPLPALIAHLGGEVRGALPSPLHATACTVGGRDGAHVVYGGGVHGPITVYLLPGPAPAPRALTPAPAGEVGLIRPLTGGGAMILFGADVPRLRELQRTLDAGVAFPGSI
ncbi:MAG TPA: DUF3379 family protein [Gammaproteobacteria bacterium]|nr:DUF3379 family protein [Gammaproteobacteria bacterium]